ncbi:metallophosphoesterase family protein [Gemmatimonadota bacterium]
MPTLLHASDLHFGKHFDPVAARAFRESLDSLAPDLIALSGDFTQRAKVSEYEDAQEFLGGLPEIPLVVTPGNHDVPLYRVWERLFFPFRNYRQHVSAELDSVTRIRGATVVALSSASPHGAIVNGKIRDRQLRFAARAFQTAPRDDLRVLVTHHNLAPAPDCLPEQVLPRHRTRLEALVGLGVDLVLAGHLHRGYLADSRDFLPDGDRDYGMLLVHSGTTTSRRGRGREARRNSFNVVAVTEDRMQVTHFVLSVEDERFVPTSTHAFPRRGSMALNSAPAHGAASERGGKGR